MRKYDKELEDQIYNDLLVACSDREFHYCPAYEIAERLQLPTNLVVQVLEALLRGGKLNYYKASPRANWYRPYELDSLGDD